MPVDKLNSYFLFVCGAANATMKKLLQENMRTGGEGMRIYACGKPSYYRANPLLTKHNPIGAML